MTRDEIRAATLEINNINKRLENIQQHGLPGEEQEVEDAAKVLERLIAALVRQS